MAKKANSTLRDRSTPGITLEDAVNEINLFMEDANDYRSSELEGKWENAERYYKGYTDLEEFVGRSNVTKTEVRDAIRNTMPSVMRTLLQSRKPVEYYATSPAHGEWVEQQSEYCTQLFHKNNGYKQLYTAILEAFKLKIGILKTFWESDPLPEYFSYTGVPMDTVEQLIDDPLMEVDDFEESEATQLGDVELYDVEGYKIHENGKIVIEAVPNYEFFITGECSSIEDAIRWGVHGQSRIASVSEAMDYGLDYDGDWLELDAEDPELSDHGGSSQERREYVKDSPNDNPSTDVLRHQFLLTECYISYDMKGTGRQQLYRFWLAGTSYQYLAHEEVSESPFDLVVPIPETFTVYGQSIADLTINEQDTGSSLLRAIVDNAHAANDAKIAADPAKTNFDDLMNPALNAPIRKRAGDTLQVIQIPFTGQGALGILQYLDQDVQNKVGITKAAQGLDPDAMQSTDKQAVMNTIMTSQGQTELMVRNIIESCLIPMFRRLLRLSIAHQSPIQMMRTKGKVIPVDTRMFDPDAAATPNVGLGTASPQQQQASLSFIYAQQKEYMQTLGPNNPFTSFAQMYNTLEDLLESSGQHNTSRYFNVVTPEIEKQWGQAQEKKQQQQQAMAEKNRPLDPSKAFVAIEDKKREIDKYKIASEARDKERARALTALVKDEDLDIKRDEMKQNRVIKLAEINQKRLEVQIKAEQAANDSGIKQITKEKPTPAPNTSTEGQDLTKPADAPDATAQGRMTR